MKQKQCTILKNWCKELPEDVLLSEDLIERVPDHIWDALGDCDNNYRRGDATALPSEHTVENYLRVVVETLCSETFEQVY